jgi:hypothetical protein
MSLMDLRLKIKAIFEGCQSETLNTHRVTKQIQLTLKILYSPKPILSCTQKPGVNFQFKGSWAQFL